MSCMCEKSKKATWDMITQGDVSTKNKESFLAVSTFSFAIVLPDTSIYLWHDVGNAEVIFTYWINRLRI